VNSAAAAVGRRRDIGGKATMRGFLGYFLIGGFAALAMGLATVAGLGLAVGARPVAAHDQLIQSVDRTHKADRLDIRGTADSRAIERVRKRPTKLLVGCEPPFSPLAVSAQENNAGRCIAELPITLTLAG
jgi:hypothetical protein